MSLNRRLLLLAATLLLCASSLGALDFPYQAKVVKIENLSHDVKRIRLQLQEGESFSFEPGQFTFIQVPEEKLLLTRYFYEKVQELGFEVGPEPELSVATYRYVPEAGDADEFNRALVDEIHRDGRVFVSTTMLDGKFVLRLAVLTFRTHLDHVDLLLEILREKVELLMTRC